MITSPEKEEWIKFHIPSRFLAAMAHTELHPEADRQPLDAYAGYAVHLGRLAAVRWLIEFVGIKEPQKATDVRIDMLGGELLSRQSAEGKQLEQSWSAISKATGHPTHNTQHSSLELDIIVPAIELLRDHVQMKLYNSASDGLQSCIQQLAATHEKRV